MADGIELTPSAGGGSSTPSGSAGGDLTGTYPNPTIKTSVALGGSPTTTTQSASDNSTKIATTAYVDTLGALKANLASPTFTGTPTLPTGTVATTQSVGDSSTKLATTAFVAANAAGLAGAVGGPAKIVYRSADATAITSNTTLASDSVLTFNVTTSSDVWWVEAYLALSGANTTHDHKLTIVAPTSWTGYVGALNQLNNNTQAWGPTTAANTPVVLNSLGAAVVGGSVSGVYGASIGAICIGDASHTGAIAVQIAQNTSDAGALQIKAGSFIRATRLA